MLVCLSVWPASVSLKAYVTVCHFQALITKTLTGNAAEAAFLPWLLRHQPVKTECHLLPLQPTAEGEDGTSTSQGLISKHRKSWGTVWCCEVLLFSEGHRCGGLDQSKTDWDKTLRQRLTDLWDKLLCHGVQRSGCGPLLFKMAGSVFCYS